VLLQAEATYDVQFADLGLGLPGPTPSGVVLYGSTGAIRTADPHVVGHIWSNSGTITISNG
jgi:hypothetical protein